MSDTNTKSAQDCPVDKVFKLAAATAKSELGTDASNKRVTATATLATKVTEAGKTVTDGADASVTLGVSHSEAAAAPECCCANGVKANCCCAAPKPESK
jgi:hypothetical protein